MSNLKCSLDPLKMLGKEKFLVLRYFPQLVKDTGLASIERVFFLNLSGSIKKKSVDANYDTVIYTCVRNQGYRPKSTWEMRGESTGDEKFNEGGVKLRHTKKNLLGS